MIHSGDDLRDIARAASVFGQPVTAEEILKANPGMDAGSVKVGQKIIIPNGKATGDTTPASNDERAPATPANLAPGQEPPAAP